MAGLSRHDQILILLVVDDLAPKQVAALKLLGRELGLRKVQEWNISSVLSRYAERAVRVPAGWEITEAGLERLHALGISTQSKNLVNVAHELRTHAASLKDDTTRSFLGEALSCYEAGNLRAAVVLSWVGAVWVLQQVVFSGHLADFNTEAIRRDAKFRPIKAADDFGRMQERDFLQIIASLSIVGKNVKQQLEQRLDLRNAAGHPNALVIGANVAAAHIETLLDNVFLRFE